MNSRRSFLKARMNNHKDRHAIAIANRKEEKQDLFRMARNDPLTDLIKIRMLISETSNTQAISQFTNRIPQFVEQVQVGCPAAQFEAAWILRNIASSNHHHAALLVHEGCISTLIKVCYHQQLTANIIEQIMGCFGNLIKQNVIYRDEFIKHKGVSLVVNYLLNGNFDLLWVITAIVRYGLVLGDLDAIIYLFNFIIKDAIVQFQVTAEILLIAKYVIMFDVNLWEYVDNLNRYIVDRMNSKNDIIVIAALQCAGTLVARGEIQSLLNANLVKMLNRTLFTNSVDILIVTVEVIHEISKCPNHISAVIHLLVDNVIPLLQRNYIPAYIIRLVLNIIINVIQSSQQALVLTNETLQDIFLTLEDAHDMEIIADALNVSEYILQHCKLNERLNIQPLRDLASTNKYPAANRILDTYFSTQI